MWAMWLACHTQAEIAERVGVTEQVIGQFLQESKVKFSENQTLLFCNFDPQIYKALAEVHPRPTQRAGSIATATLA